jgi:DNA repair exonuclease SbcCD ATPase subunit
MTTRLKTLEWDNYFSYGKGNKVDFTENKVTQILGVNGNGKSSIPLILEEVCYNKNSKGISKADIPNRAIGKGTWAQLEFEKDGEQYILTVDRRGASIKAKLEREGTDISSHTATGTYKTIEQLLGNDFKTFSQLVYQNTNTSLQFLTATDTTRKKFLIDLLQLDEYVRLFEVFKEAVKEHASAVTGIEGQIFTVENWLKSNRLEDTTPIEPKRITIDIFDDERRAAGLTNELANINRTNKQIANNNQYRQLLEAIDIHDIQAMEVPDRRNYDDEQSSLGGLRSELSGHERHLTKLSGLGNVCPTCEQDIDSEFKERLISDEQEAINGLKGKIQSIQELIEQIKEDNKKHDYKQSKIKEWEDLFRQLDSKLPTELINKQDLEDELSNLSIKISNARAELKKLQQFNEEAARHNSRIQLLQEQAVQYEKQLSELATKLEEQKEYLADLEVLKKAFSTNGLVAYKIENMVKDLEELTNDYLAELSDGRFTIEFSVVSDKLNVIITDNGRQISIGSLSSGELARVNTSTLLALRKLMNSISKSEINVLFLDEVISVLDDAGKEKLVEVLLEEDLNTYVIAHSWSHPLLAKLEVIKENEISRIEQG